MKTKTLILTAVSFFIIFILTNYLINNILSDFDEIPKSEIKKEVNGVELTEDTSSEIKEKNEIEPSIEFIKSELEKNNFKQVLGVNDYLMKEIKKTSLDVSKQGNDFVYPIGNTLFDINGNEFEKFNDIYVMYDFFICKKGNKLYYVSDKGEKSELYDSEIAYDFYLSLGLIVIIESKNDIRYYDLNVETKKLTINYERDAEEHSNSLPYYVHNYTLKYNEHAIVTEEYLKLGSSLKIVTLDIYDSDNNFVLTFGDGRYVSSNSTGYLINGHVLIDKETKEHINYSSEMLTEKYFYIVEGNNRIVINSKGEEILNLGDCEIYQVKSIDGFYGDFWTKRIEDDNHIFDLYNDELRIIKTYKIKNYKSFYPNINDKNDFAVEIFGEDEHLFKIYDDQIELIKNIDCRKYYNLVFDNYDSKEIIEDREISKSPFFYLYNENNNDIYFKISEERYEAGPIIVGNVDNNLDIENLFLIIDKIPDKYAGCYNIKFKDKNILSISAKDEVLINLETKEFITIKEGSSAFYNKNFIIITPNESKILYITDLYGNIKLYLDNYK